MRVNTIIIMLQKISLLNRYVFFLTFYSSKNMISDITWINDI